MSQLITSYREIFNLVPETCKITGIKRASERKDDKSYDFIAVIESPTSLEDTIATAEDCKRISEKVKKYNIGGPDIIYSVKWKNDKDKNKKFNYSAHLIPENIFEFKIEKGLYKIIAKCHGFFFN
jgi:hypothetical protein